METNFSNAKLLGGINVWVIIEKIIAVLFVICWQDKAALLHQRSLTSCMSASDLLKGQAIVWN